MKITTRIISGYGLLIAVLAGLVVYQVFTINRMQDTNRTLSKINFQYGIDCLQVLRDRDLVEEYTRKAFILADPLYLQRLKEFAKEFEQSLFELRRKANSEEERTETQRLVQQWNSFTANVEQLQKQLTRGGNELPEALQDNLEQLRIQINSVYQASLKSMSAKVGKSRQDGETAVLVLWISTFSAFAISVLISLIVVRSISKPLASLTEGTRAIADGKFSYRLDTSRNDEFSQVARDFNKMTSRLNELDELKKGFVSHVSHELKAPLASMRETAQLMLEELPGPLTDKQKRFLELNIQSGTRLTAMIGNLLDLSRIEAGVMEYEMKNHDLVPLSRDAIAEIEANAHERNVELIIGFPEEPIFVECDGDRIAQVVINLVGNAVKFSPKESGVEIKLERIQELPESWRKRSITPDQGGYFGLMTVIDRGPGIPNSEKESVFEKFHQVKQGKKLSGQGVGLGLAICKTIVQAHRGGLWIEDNPGGGCRFMLLLRSAAPK